MKKLSLVSALCLFVVVVIWGQETQGVCGTSATDQWEYTERLDANIATMENGGLVKERGAVQYVPIHFHIVGDVNGDGKHRENLILDQLCDLNEAYAPMEIRFYLNPHPTYGLFDYSINNTNVYTEQSSSFLMQNRRHNSALNVYIVNVAAGSDETLAYYSPPNDWVVSRKSQINGSGNGTLPHEIGHFFSLRHTFYGWELDGQSDTEPSCFDSADPGWPIAPVNAPYKPNGMNIPTERVDGSNCTTAADKICDTPPDYNLGSCNNNNCNPYTGPAKDPAGTQVDPMENNFMSYFFNCNNYIFTPMQQSVILADRETAFRNYLDNNFSPEATEINTPNNLLVSPLDDVTVNYYDEVQIEWQPVVGATYYLLEFDLTNIYSSTFYQSFIVTGTSKLVTTLLPNKNYFWRVRPFNQYVACAASRERSFKTPQTSATNDIYQISNWKIAPNPVTDGISPHLLVNASDDFEAGISVFDATGRRVSSLQNIQFPAGETTLELPMEGLVNGLYFVAIENGEGRSVRKISILR